jgi:predicted CXXCH cytochrome family protein
MLFRVPIAAFVMGALAVGNAWAQHGLESSTVVSPDYRGCALCHASHIGTATEYALRVDDLPTLSKASAAGGPSPGPVSRSCLRCHLTSEVRARQPEFASSSGVGGQDSKLLQWDLTDDHPVGRIVRSGIKKTPDTPTGTRRSTMWDAFTRSPDYRETRVECTSCHDPHSRTGDLRNVGQVGPLCESCHEPTSYSIGDHAGLDCTGCHQLHGGHRAAFLAEPFVDALCSSCHSPSQTSLGASRTGINMSAATTAHSEPVLDSCLSCHSAH